MTNYYDDPEYWKEKGVDYNLLACLEYNPQETFKSEDIKKVVAVHEGENDAEDWIWIIELRPPTTYAFLQGWCDYTGWDCQSDAISLLGATPLIALEAGMIMAQEEWHRIVSPYGRSKYIGRYTDLMLQIETGDKAVTWREKMDKRFGLTKE